MNSIATRRLVYNFAIVRFMPCPAAGEFVNVGVVVNIPETGQLDFRLLGLSTHARVTNFFPEFKDRQNLDIYKEAVRSLREVLLKARQAAVGADNNDVSQPVMPWIASERNQFFMNLVRPLESILSFSAIRSGMTESPAKITEELFMRYVSRDHADHVGSFNERMKIRLSSLLEEHRLLNDYIVDCPIGEPYHAVFPFACKRENHIVRAIKPMDFNKPNHSDIYDYASQWIGRLGTMKLLKVIPDKIIIVVNEPESLTTENNKAVKFAKKAFEDLNSVLIDHKDEPAIIEQARIA